MKIGIIGAGIGGLVAALWLQRDGHQVDLFEQQARPAAIGAGLSLFGNSFDALDAVGLGSLVRRVTSGEAAAFKAGQRSPSGAWMVVLPPKATASLRAVHRAALHNALTEALTPGTLHLGADAAVSPEGAPEITVNGGTGHFDLVIAADGINSAARQALGLDPGLRYAGYTAWRGVTDGPFDLGREAGETWGRGERFGMVPLPDGRVYWFATANLPPETRLADDRAELLCRFGSWHQPIAALLENTAPDAVLKHDIRDLATPLPSYGRGRTLLLGDAAHAMTPDLGQGAGQAIEDAAAIVLLAREGRLGLPSYDKARRRRSQLIASRSRVMGRVGQLSSPFAAGLRDAALRLVPGSVVGAAAVKFQAWAPPGR
ncbi:FAD-binding monooxygenase [Arthrobacter sp. PAMC 25486]|uniref:FAD-dependent monooxygenase n=1 Tax=Arthrobacter sp. PAMC 25486 TaxID=1494608 RepID=UPI00053629F5|nr:FAD-dependent monooxygenase [Arthrobacter sp. PAMC 25486]AIY00698.1 FAD-binding monooxygenase [Arthrobacter sp. PAMC 25486]